MTKREFKARYDIEKFLQQYIPYEWECIENYWLGATPKGFRANARIGKLIDRLPFLEDLLEEGFYFDDDKIECERLVKEVKEILQLA